MIILSSVDISFPAWPSDVEFSVAVDHVATSSLLNINSPLNVESCGSSSPPHWSLDVDSAVDVSPVLQSQGTFAEHQEQLFPWHTTFLHLLWHLATGSGPASFGFTDQNWKNLSLSWVFTPVKPWWITWFRISAMAFNLVLIHKVQRPGYRTLHNPSYP